MGQRGGRMRRSAEISHGGNGDGALIAGAIFGGTLSVKKKLCQN